MKTLVKEQFVYDKQQSVIISGVAILMMLMHHFWGFPQVLVDDNTFIPLFSIFNISIEQILGSIGKLCVGIFAFNTGYVIWKKKEDYTLEKNFKRIKKFLVSYWIIYFLFLLYGFLFDENIPSIQVFLYNLIGLNTGYYVNSVNVTFAWYVCFYVTFVLASPILLSLLRHTSIAKDVIISVLWCLINIILKIQQLDNSLVYILSLYFSIGIFSWGGLIFCKYNLFDKLQYLIGRKFINNFLLLLFVVMIRQLLLFIYPYFSFNEIVRPLFLSLDALYAPLFVFSVVNIISNLNYRLLERCFSTLGKNSMNMWFIHGIFFTASMKLQWILYMPKYSMIVLVWGLLLVLLCSIFVAQLQKNILRFI